jgi:hypothetical protein
VLSTVQLCCLIAGLVVSLVAAHDRALRVLPPGHRVSGQLAVMLTLTAYAFTLLYLLFGG